MTDLIKRYPALAECRGDIQAALDMMIRVYTQKHKVLVCGNGGSAADCEHIVGELMKGFMSKRCVADVRIPEDMRAHLQGALPAISLPSQSAVLSAFANDVEPSMVYAQLVYGYGQPGDMLICLSTSGNSPNVVNAAKVAKALGLSTLALTGARDSVLSELCDVTVKAPECETYRVQELHLPIYHFLCAQTEKILFGE